MNQAQIAQIVAAVVIAINANKGAKQPVKAAKVSSYKPANKAEPKGKISQSDRKIRNEANVVKAFAKQGITVLPRQNALTYKGWLSQGMRVIPGQKGTWVKGVGTLFHSGQVAAEDKISKADMASEAAALLAKAKALG